MTKRRVSYRVMAPVLLWGPARFQIPEDPNHERAYHHWFIYVLLAPLGLTVRDRALFLSNCLFI